MFQFCVYFLDGLKPPPSFTTYVVFDVPDHLPGLQVSRDQKTLVLFSVYRRLYATQLIPKYIKIWFHQISSALCKGSNLSNNRTNKYFLAFHVSIATLRIKTSSWTSWDHSLQETPRIWKERHKKCPPGWTKISKGLRKLQFWGFHVCFLFVALMGVFWKMFFFEMVVESVVVQNKYRKLGERAWRLT